MCNNLTFWYRNGHGGKTSLEIYLPENAAAFEKL